jgi:hypothetical protein
MHGVQYSRHPITSCADAHMPGAGKIGNVCSRSRDREDIADREGVADRADVPDQEIGKMLSIRKILPIGKMIVLFISEAIFNRVQIEFYVKLNSISISIVF